MTPTDPLTPEEVERLDPETRGYYQRSSEPDRMMVVGTCPVWLRDHIIRAARMEALVQEVEKTTCFCDDWMNNPAGEKCWFCRAKAVLALAPPERSK